MKKIFILLCALLCVGIVHAKGIYSYPLSESNRQSLKAVQAQLSEADHLSGDFKQIRKMRLLSSPLVSKGHFILSKKNGLQWYQTSPFKSTLIVTSSKIEQRIEKTPPTIIAEKEQPVVFTFTNIFLSIFRGDSESIESYFKIFFKGDVNQWEIAFKPIESPLNKAIASIEMTGGKYVNSITVNEAKKNQMILKFFNVKKL